MLPRLTLRTVLLAWFISLLLSGFLPVQAREPAPAPAIGQVRLADLPPEAAATLQLIERGGPFPYPRKDGSVFGNFEKRLPLQARGYYREYTVPTPGSRTRGTRRIIAGQVTASEYYYTPDHYRSFSRIRQP